MKYAMLAANNMRMIDRMTLPQIMSILWCISLAIFLGSVFAFSQNPTQVITERYIENGKNIVTA